MEKSKLKDLPIGTEVILDARYDGEAIIWVIVHKNNSLSSIYPKDSVLLMAKHILSIKAFDGKENNTRYFFNSEIEFGSNDWNSSCIRKWLNTFGECHWEFEETSAPYANNVVYNAYDKELGFLTSFSNETISGMIPVTVQTARKNSRRETKDLVFLPSKTELGIRCKDKEGETFDYFKTIIRRMRRIAYPTYKSTQRIEKSFRDDFAKFDRCSPWRYMTRSIDEKAKIDFCRVSTIDSKGKLDSMFAFTGWAGVRPVICMTNDVEAITMKSIC